MLLSEEQGHLSQRGLADFPLSFIGPKWATWPFLTHSLAKGMEPL